MIDPSRSMFPKALEAFLRIKAEEEKAWLDSSQDLCDACQHRVIFHYLGKDSDDGPFTACLVTHRSGRGKETCRCNGEDD